MHSIPDGELPSAGIGGTSIISLTCGNVPVYPGIIRETNRPWEEVLSLGRQRCFSKGYLLSLGPSVLNHFFYVRRGRFCTYYANSNGTSRINLFFESGSLYNDCTCITQAVSQGIVMRCWEDTEVFEFPGDLLRSEKFRQQYPHLMDNLLYSIALKVLNFQELLNAVCTKNKFQLVCWYLYVMAEKNKGRLAFDPNVSQSDIAMILGISQSSLTKIVSRLKEEEILNCFTKHRLHILDLFRLRRLGMSSD